MHCNSFCTGAKIRPISSLKIKSKNNNSTEGAKSRKPTIYIGTDRYLPTRGAQRAPLPAPIIFITTTTITDGSSTMANRVLPRIVVIDCVCDLLNIYCHSSISPLILRLNSYRFFYCRGGRATVNLGIYLSIQHLL